MTASSLARPSWLLAVAPLALAVLEMWHPVIQTGTPAGLEPLIGQAQIWTFVHLAQLPLFGLTAWAVASLLAGDQSRVASLARGLLAAFAVAYSAFDSFAGLATVTVIQAGQALQAGALPVAIELARAIFLSPITAVLFLLGTGCWTLGAGLAAFALLKAGAARIPVALLALAALALWGGHRPPFGPITFGLAAVAMLWLALAGRGKAVPVVPLR
jgi:hypothetical protein